MSPGELGGFWGILAVAFSLLASASGFGGLCRVLGYTAVGWVTGRILSEGLPAMSPGGVGWFFLGILAVAFSLLASCFRLRRVVLRLGGPTVALRAMAGKHCSLCGRTASDGLPGVSPRGAAGL